MKKILAKVISSGIIASILIIPSISVKAEETGSSTNRAPRLEQIREMEKNRIEALRENRASTTLNREARLENRGEIMRIRIERPFLLASTTEKRLENRENNIERIRERIASTTASSTKRLEKLDDRLEKQREQMAKVKERLLNKEIKAADVLGKIAAKTQSRIATLEARGLDLTTAKAKLAEATSKIEAMAVEADNLATLVNTEITEANKDTLFTSIKASQAKIRTLAREAHAQLVDTVKEITKVLPRNGRATTTATSTI